MGIGRSVKFCQKPLLNAKIVNSYEFYSGYIIKAAFFGFCLDFQAWLHFVYLQAKAPKGPRHTLLQETRPQENFVIFNLRSQTNKSRKKTNLLLRNFKNIP